MTNNKKQITKSNYNNKRNVPADTGKTNNNGVNVHIGKIDIKIKIPITINFYNR